MVAGKRLCPCRRICAEEESVSVTGKLRVEQYAWEGKNNTPIHRMVGSSGSDDKDLSRRSRWLNS